MIYAIDNRVDRLPWAFLPLDDDGVALLCLVQRVERTDGRYDHRVEWSAECSAGRAERDRLLDALRLSQGEWPTLGRMLVEHGPSAMWTCLVELVCPGGMPMPVGRA